MTGLAERKCCTYPEGLYRVDPTTGAHYHLTHDPPPTAAIAQRVVRHPRDSEEEIRRRLTDATAFKEELLDLYPSVSVFISPLFPFHVS